MASPLICAPSAALLRTFLLRQPAASSTCSCQKLQSRSASNWAPRSSFHKVNRLDKLHRRQKAAIRAEKQATIDRAASMPIPMIPPPTAATTITTVTGNPSLAQSVPFTVERTASNNLPVYQTAKAGGTRHITTIRRLSGDLDALVELLKPVLGLQSSFRDQAGRKKENIIINRLTQQVVIRGWRGPEVEKWISGLGF